MGFSAHRGTAGHTIGASIIGKDKHGDGDSQAGKDAGHTAMGFQRITVEPAANGLSVRHMPASPSGEGGHGSSIGHPESGVEEQLHVFRDATEAHHHIGQLLGVRMGSGAQQV